MGRSLKNEETLPGLIPQGGSAGAAFSVCGMCRKGERDKLKDQRKLLTPYR